jgi:hypothetical protein
MFAAIRGFRIIGVDADVHSRCPWPTLGTIEGGVIIMTKALKKACEAASRLPDREQEELAAAILEEIAADERWDSAFAESQSMLKRLADEAVREQRASRSEVLDPDAL